MQFKDGALVSLIQDMPVIINDINMRFSKQSFLYYFLSLCKELFGVPNQLCLILIPIILYVGGDSTISVEFPNIVLWINLGIMLVPMFHSKLFMLDIIRDINNQQVDVLQVNRRSPKFIKASWGTLKAGDIIRVNKREQFPADCLILDCKS
jgi:magnesium-transporting ATPase (P-type)